MENVTMLSWVAWIFVVVGGVDSGLYGLFKFHFIEAILGANFLGRIVFVLIGVAAGYLIYLLGQQKNWFKKLKQ